MSFLNKNEPGEKFRWIDKILTHDVSIVFLIALAFLGVFKYAEYRLEIISTETNSLNSALLAKNNDLEQRVAKIEERLGGALSYLSETEQKNSSLENQFNEITNTVGALSKLSKTDPELLKKYSKVYFLNEHYVPISLSDVGQTFTSAKSTNNKIHSDVLPHLEKMIDAGNSDGVAILVQSAYRSFQTQAVLKSNYKVTYGAGTANRFSADQGYSEHQLGTAVDFTTLKTNGALEGFSKTPEYQWLTENAYKYGFVISYPAGNKYYKYEPWHWRYVGVALATKLYEDGMNFYDMDQRIIDNYLANIFD